MAHDITVSMEKLQQFSELIHSNYVNTARSLLNIMGSKEDEDDNKFLETDILAQMTMNEMESLQSHLNPSKLIHSKLNWMHITSALMHELDEKMSYHVMKVVKKLNVTTIALSESMEKALNKKMSKQEINYFRELINRAIKNTHDSDASSIASVFKKQHDASRVADVDDITVNVLMDIFNVRRIFTFSNFHFEPYKKEQFIQAIKDNKFLKQDKDAICNRFNAKYAKHVPFVLYPSWLIADDQFLIFNYFFCCSYIVDKLRVNPPRNECKFSIYIIPNRVVSIYDENISFPTSIPRDLSLFLTQNGFHNFSRTAIKESDARDPRILLQVIEYHLNSPRAHYLQQDVLLIVDRRQKENVLYVLNASVNHNKLMKLQQNHLIGMEFDILSPNNEDSVVQCYFSKGIGEKIRFYPEYLTFLMCRIFKKNNKKWSDFEYIQNVYAPSYRHAFGTNLKDANFDKYHQLILNILHISVNYDRNYVESELKDDDDDTDDSKQSDNNQYIAPVVDESADITEWKQKCSLQDIKPAPECPYINFIMRELRKFSAIDKYEINASNNTQFNELLLNLALDHLITVHSFSSLEAERASIKKYMHNKNGACKHGKECVVLQRFSKRRREDLNRDANEGKRGKLRMKFENEGMKINMMMHTLSTLHCYLEHQVFDLYREEIGGQNNKFSTIVQRSSKFDDIAAINFGKSILEWLEFDQIPKYKSFRDEIINGSSSTIDADFYEMYKAECVLLVAVFENKFGLKEILSIKLYTDTTELCKQFRMTHWKEKEKSEKNKNMKKEFYWWSLTLFKTMLYHSKPLNKISKKSTKPMTVYHGLSDVFVLDDNCPFYNGPISTTSDVSVAHRFSSVDGKGLNWVICPSYTNPFKFVHGLDVRRISCYSEENEVLLCNAYLPISYTKNYNDDDGIKINLFLKQIKMYKQKEINASDFYAQIGFKLQKSWIQSIKQHPLLYHPLDINKNERVIHRLRTVFNIKALDGPYIILSATFEQNKAFKNFGALYTLNIDEKYLHYFKECTYKFVFGNKKSKTIRYNESVQFNQDNAKATVFVSNERVFESKEEFEVQQISISAQQTEITHSCFQMDEKKKVITFNQKQIPSTRKDILESILNAKYQIKYCNTFKPNAVAKYGKEYKCALSSQFAVPVCIPPDVTDIYCISLMVAPLATKAPIKNVQGKWCNYQSNLDENGVFYALGTNFGQNKYTNPGAQGKLSIVSSQDLGIKMHCLVDRKRADFVIQGHNKNDPPFFYINVGEYGLKPTRYTLRNSDKDSGYLTHWSLLASNDGIEWFSLKEHKNDTTLKKEGAFEAASWEITTDDYKTDVYFSYFKVLMKATNHAGEWKFGCCGFELYGHLMNSFQYVYDSMTVLKSFVPTKMQINSAKPVEIDYELNVDKFDLKTGSGGCIEIYSSSDIIIQKDGSINANDVNTHTTFKYGSDLDTNGVLYGIATQFGTLKYQNPATTGLVSVGSSTEAQGSAEPFIGRDNVQAWYSSRDFYVDLKKYKLRPVAYTLKNSKWEGASVTEWNLEASNDGQTWICLKKHTGSDGAKLKGEFASHSWTLNDIDDFYSFFRIVMTKIGGASKWVLCLSGMEFYGDLMVAEESASKQDSSTVDFTGGKSGKISLYSDASIINHGNITANATNDCISIKCNTFKNFGCVQSTNNGRIVIECESFENKSVIDPKPILISKN